MICLAAGTKIVPLLVGAMTLAWTHSVEKILWEEDWQSGRNGLEIVAARVRGSGAGMDPAPDARFVNGAWEWHPKLPPLKEVVLRRSGATADWRVCVAGHCRPMSDYVPPEADPVVMKECPER
jgi:hypothetical protein